MDVIHIPVELLGDSCSVCGTKAEDGDEFYLSSGQLLCKKCYREQREVEVEMYVRTFLDEIGLEHIELSKVHLVQDEGSG